VDGIIGWTSDGGVSRLTRELESLVIGQQSSEVPSFDLSYHLLMVERCRLMDLRMLTVLWMVVSWW
jgi:hypothetical protein